MITEEEKKEIVARLLCKTHKVVYSHGSPDDTITCVCIDCKRYFCISAGNSDDERIPVEYYNNWLSRLNRERCEG